MGESSLFVPDPAAHWWPRDLGSPSATGNQNNVRYAYFANAHRLAVETNGQVWVYDTLDHQIGGFSQQLRIPAKMTAHSGERDRFAHRIGAGEFFLTEAVTISQGGRMVLV